MEDRSRARLAWVLSILLHGLAFLLVFPGSPRAGGPGLRLVEVGLVELAEEGPPSTATSPAAALEIARAPKPTQKEETAAGEAEAGATETASPSGTPSPPPAPAAPPPGNGGGRPGAEPGPKFGFGTGEGLVQSHPLYYPKGAQNEGVEGTVRLAIVLKPDGSARAEILVPSGDGRLDLYGLRAVTEAWRYERPPVPVRLEVELVFAGGEARARFLGSEVLPEEDTP